MVLPRTTCSCPGTHVGTHIDALGHVSHCGQLHGGVDAAAAQLGGRLTSHGVEQIPPIVARCLLLDIPAVRGVESLPGGEEITPEDLEAALARTGTEIRPGDVLLIRSGWGCHWSDGEAYVGRESGVPGVGEAGARWLASRRPVAVGADTIAFECLAPGTGHALLPAHRVLLVDEGIYIIETMALDELAAAGATVCTIVVAPLHLVGATGFTGATAGAGRGRRWLSRRCCTSSGSSARSTGSRPFRRRSATALRRVCSTSSVWRSPPPGSRRRPPCWTSLRTSAADPLPRPSVSGIAPRRRTRRSSTVCSRTRSTSTTRTCPSIVHPSASVVPAALAMGEAHGASGQELLASIAVGLEITVRLGMAGYRPATDDLPGQSIYFEHGQHATSICGAIGSAAAAARLCGLDAAGIAHAMGVACSMASGIIEANRTGGTVKRLHCGWAAQAGVTAAMLVERGITGAPTALEGRFGLFQALLRDEWSAAPVLDGLGDRWEAASIFYKPYPANHFTHTAIDAAIRLRDARSDARPTIDSAHLCGRDAHGAHDRRTARR